VSESRTVRASDEPFRVVALLSSYNEGDIIGAVIGHLVEHGVEVYLLDNHSTDDTVEQASRWLGRGLIDIERFPSGDVPDRGDAGRFDWTAILMRKEALAQIIDADWFMHQDADEVRESPWHGLSLRDAIRWVDRLDYNCIDFRVFEFPPVDDGFRQGMDPCQYFTRHRPGKSHDQLQLKCWKAGAGSVSLTHYGGHDVQFDGRRPFPVQFLLRHYPVRSQAHGVRKVFDERKPRFTAEERAKTWHQQYDLVASRDHVFLADPEFLQPFDLERARLEVLLDHRTARDQASAAQQAIERLETRVAALTAANDEGDALARDLEARAGVLEYQLGVTSASFVRREAEYQHALAQLGAPLAAVRGPGPESREPSDNSAGQLESLTLTAERDEARRHCETLQARTDALAAQVAQLEGELSRVGLELNNVYTSRTWRWGEPLGRYLTLGRFRKRPQ
jgi:hypothetical protein